MEDQVSRRNLLLRAGATGAVAGVAAVTARRAIIRQREAPDKAVWRPAATPLTGGDELRYLQLTSGTDGVIYGVRADGALVWLRHLDWRTGGVAWANSGDGRVIGEGWHQYVSIAGDSFGHIYGLRRDGTLCWHRWDLSNAETGEGSWARGSGRAIRNLAGTSALACGGDGVLYARCWDTKLYWHKYLARDGSAGPGAWAPNSGAVIAQDLPGKWLMADREGVVYTIADGHLTGRKYLAGDGSSGPGSWANGGKPAKFGRKGFDDLWKVMAAGDGVFYTMPIDARPDPNPADHLHWRRLRDWSAAATGGAGTWSKDSGKRVASGLVVHQAARMEAYVWPPSVTSGERLGIAVSTAMNGTISIRHLSPGGKTQPVTYGPVPFKGKVHPLPHRYRARGCGWPHAQEVTIPPNWPSGLYCAEVRAEDGTTVDVAFSVRPPKPKAKTAFLVSTYTSLAYNTWDGANQYGPGYGGRRRVFSLQRPNPWTDLGTNAPPEHVVTTDITITNLMAGAGHAFDCYDDGDLHREGGRWLPEYRTLVTGAHPEYFSAEMRRHLAAFLDRGGRLLYLGGNGLYERVEPTPDGTAVRFRDPWGDRWVNRWHDQPESEILGIGYAVEAYNTAGPYRVLRDHPLLAGTGLKPGQTFGATGGLGPAAGVETDRRMGTRGDALETEVIAAGENHRTHGAEMVFTRRPGGGWTFGVGSVTFAGAIPQDPAVRQIVLNALKLAELP
ncbi:N,N-dimethylformamidase beta subunit family domain-containing protein [Longispora albida]|uniref:N,N-dimethylformamidase beta subunit family domain-containing protein n=1 Tax=Longispora albida TaxID=203523 RepID=UPI00037584C4|nr:N,N-dimethylformamidase beta subunit family domain-containing protein [Longispora albida]